MSTTHTPETLKSWQAGLGLSESGMAAYVGVPLHTWRKWLNGTRKPDAAPCALLDLLAVLPAECPALHALRLDNAHKAAKPLKATQVSPGRKKRAIAPLVQPVAYSAGAFLHAYGENLDAVRGGINTPNPWVHVAQVVPEWMKTEA